MSDNDKRGGTGPNTGVVVRARPKTRKPAMYKVLMLNDDYTPMEFVVHILEKILPARPARKRCDVMLHVHRHGVGMCGVYTYRSGGDQGGPGDRVRPPPNQHPLQCTMEKE